MSEITIDDLSHENSLIRARNERLEAEKVELLKALTGAHKHLEGCKRAWLSTPDFSRRVNSEVRHQLTLAMLHSLEAQSKIEAVLTGSAT